MAGEGRWGLLSFSEFREGTTWWQALRTPSLLKISTERVGKIYLMFGDCWED